MSLLVSVRVGVGVVTGTMGEDTSTQARKTWRRRPRTSAALAAVSYAFIPLTISLTGQGSNPFYYNTIAKASQVPVALLFLYFGTRQYLPSSTPGLRGLLTKPSSYLIAYRRGHSYIAKSPRDLLRMPLFWICIGFFDYALFAWSTAFVDTAIASTLFELWPILFVVFLVRIQKQAERDEGSVASGVYKGFFRDVTSQQWVLICIAPIGMYFVFASRTDGLDVSLSDYVGDDIVGLALALGAAFLTSLPPAMSIIYGRFLQEHYHLSEGAESKSESNTRTGQRNDEASIDDQRLWFTVFGFAIALSWSTILNLGVGSILQAEGLYVSAKGIYGSVVLGAILLAPASILLRKANHDTDDASVNSIFFFSPVLALFLLSVSGIVLARFDFFVIGASLILIVNILLQANPDPSLAGWWGFWWW